MRVIDLRWRASATTAAVVIASIVAGTPAVSSRASAKVDDVVISPSDPWWTSRIGMHSPTIRAIVKNQTSGLDGRTVARSVVDSVAARTAIPSSETTVT